MFRYISSPIIKHLISSIALFLLPEQIDRDYSQLPVVRRLFDPWAVRAVVYGDVYYMCLFLLLGLP